jgi:hypothetical protein
MSDRGPETLDRWQGPRGSADARPPGTARLGQPIETGAGDLENARREISGGHPGDEEEPHERPQDPHPGTHRSPLQSSSLDQHEILRLDRLQLGDRGTTGLGPPRQELTDRLRRVRDRRLRQTALDALVAAIGIAKALGGVIELDTQESQGGSSQREEPSLAVRPEIMPVINNLTPPTSPNHRPGHPTRHNRQLNADDIREDTRYAAAAVDEGELPLRPAG